MEIPSLALRCACARPVILAVMRLAMAWPAASSLALLMRRPEDRRSMEVCRALCERPRFCCPIRDVMLVLITDMAKFLQLFAVGYRRAVSRDTGPVDGKRRGYRIAVFRRFARR